MTTRLAHAIQYYDVKQPYPASTGVITGIDIANHFVALNAALTKIGLPPKSIPVKYLYVRWGRDRNTHLALICCSHEDILRLRFELKFDYLGNTEDINNMYKKTFCDMSDLYPIQHIKQMLSYGPYTKKQVKKFGLVFLPKFPSEIHNLNS